MVISEAHPLVLGSGSPRRREILTGLGVPIVVVVGSVDETPHGAEDTDAYLLRVVRDKLAAAAAKLATPGDAPAIVVADTIVVVDGDILGKPRDEADAVVLLSRIVGRAHVVRTRYAIQVGGIAGGRLIERTVDTRVTMRAARPELVARYAATHEGLDKAGAYAAQGIGAFLVEKIDGSFSNVVGLPACEVVGDLVELGLLPGFPRAAR
ncbi:MAG TPA: Maf family nucleotide pyrophosphatase [Polyangiaceae bacterium]|jgi:septum formation protein|nr:Maf family nucleotide pyrophosphatase [Polyangiaceae bacterium]